MGEEVKTTDEPEAAHLRGVLRQIRGVVERSYETEIGWGIDLTEGMRLIRDAVDRALARPRTNGAVIDELYGKIAALEGKLVDRGLDREQLALARAERDQAVGLIEQLQVDNRALRAVLAKPKLTQTVTPEPPPSPLDDDIHDRPLKR